MSCSETRFNEASAAIDAAKVAIVEGLKKHFRNELRLDDDRVQYSWREIGNFENLFRDLQSDYGKNLPWCALFSLMWDCKRMAAAADMADRVEDKPPGDEASA